MTPVAGKYRPLDTECLAKVHMIIWNRKGIPTRSMENVKWYSPSQVPAAKHVSYPQLTATKGEVPKLGHSQSGGRFSFVHVSGMVRVPFVLVKI